MMLYIAAIIMIGVLSNRIGMTILNLIPDRLIRSRWLSTSEDEMARALRMIPFVTFVVGTWNLIILAGYDSQRDGPPFPFM